MTSRARTLAATLLWVGACAGPREGVRLGPQGQVTLIDTLPAFAAALRGDGGEEAADVAWTHYEAACLQALASAGAEPNDPGDTLLFKVSANPAALLTLVDGFEQAGPAELNALVADFASKLGGVPDARVVFAVARAWTPVFRGSQNGHPVLLFNGRAPELATPPGRRASFARELFRLLHEVRNPDSASLGPLALEVYRSGAASFAARQLVSQASESAVLGLDERALVKLRGREALIAKELLAALDSARPVERARFFDASVSDPLLSPGAGRYLADRLYQRIAEAEGSLQAPLRLSPTDFLQRARPALTELAGAK